LLNYLHNIFFAAVAILVNRNKLFHEGLFTFSKLIFGQKKING
jgi:hypothetical protein